MTTMLKSAPARTDLDLVRCPECHEVALVEWRDKEVADGSVALAKVRCLQRHWFLMPGDQLVRA
jgi:hypothetical protein